MAINKVFLAGHLTRDPELRSTAEGNPVLSFGIAVNERIRDKQTGEWRDRGNFFDCTMFGARAESLSRFLSKGNKVSIEGRLRWNQWERDGEKRTKVEIVVSEIELMNARPSEDESYSPEPVSTEAPAATSIYDQDIPF